MTALFESIDVQLLNLMFAKLCIKITNFSISLIVLSLRYLILVIDNTDGRGLINKPFCSQ